LLADFAATGKGLARAPQRCARIAEDFGTRRRVIDCRFIRIEAKPLEKDRRSDDVTTVANSGADQFIKRLPRDIGFYLVHGNDEGLIRERSKGIVSALLDGDADPMRVTRFDGDALARAPGALPDEAYSISMFGGHRVIWIELGARDISPALEPLFDSPPRDCTIVVEAGSLKKGAALRSAFEKMVHGASIECYPDDRKSMSAMVDAEARQTGISIAPDVRDYLIGFLGSDRMTTRGEIAKLFRYVEGRDNVSAADVEAIVSDAAPSPLDDVIDSAFLGDQSAVEETAGRFFSEGGDPAFMMIAIVRRALILHRSRLEVDQGRSIDIALQAQHLRLSPLRRGALERQISRWSALKLARLTGSLRAASGRVRREPKMAEMTTMRALWAIASAARPSGA
jgi:DNA polymerase-3 subunit delta